MYVFLNVAITIVTLFCSFSRQYLYPFINDVDGVFVLQSKYDTANLGIVSQLRLFRLL